MAGTGNGSYDWADQWDYGGDSKNDGTVSAAKTGSAAKYKHKLGEGLGKTRAAASNGVNKLKQRTSLGFQWIKDKYNKTAHKN